VAGTPARRLFYFYAKREEECMSETQQDVPMAKRGLVYPEPQLDRIVVRRDVEFRGADGEALHLDLYTPANAVGAVPVVVLVGGYPDEGFRKFLGCSFKEMQSNVSWARWIAASGMAAIAYTNRAPAADLAAVLRAIRENAVEYGVDADRIGVWASSGNVPVALSALMNDAPERVRCAALCYGYTLDLEGSDGVAEAAKVFRFANPNGGRTVDDLREDVALFIARAGKDDCARLNESLDRFVTHALRRNLSIACVNHRDAPHAFDIVHDSETSREIIRQVLAFLQFQLMAPQSPR
jgi:hypothetical protein